MRDIKTEKSIYRSYQNGEVDLPELPVILELNPIAGNDTAHIQSAVDYGSTHGDVDWQPGEIDMYFTDVKKCLLVK